MAITIKSQVEHQRKVGCQVNLGVLTIVGVLSPLRTNLREVECSEVINNVMKFTRASRETVGVLLPLRTNLREVECQETVGVLQW